MNKAGLIVVMAGGTGGHVFPGLATAEQLQRAGCEVKWLGTRKGIEARLVPAAGIEIRYLHVSGIRGKGLAKLLLAPFQLLRALLEALLILRKLNPDCVLGMGGFAAGPGGLAAWLMRKPLIIHEQNAVAGTTNRLLAYIATRIYTAFPDAFPGNPKAQQVGNPIRSALSHLPEPVAYSAGGAEKREALKLLVLGGSLGAKPINDLLLETLSDLKKKGVLGATLKVWHQAGAAHYQSVQERYTELGLSGRVDAFIEDMPAAYQWANLIICRAGALTVSEIAAVGRASILIPFPYAIDDHQTRNAEWLAKADAAVLLPQSSLEPSKLGEILQSFAAAPERLSMMAVNARKLARPQAAEQLAQACMEYACA